MSNLTVDNLTPERIQQFLNAVGTESTEDTSHNIDAVDYKWGKSTYFNNNEVALIKNFVKQFAVYIAEKLSIFFQGSYNADMTSITQHYAKEFGEQSEKQQQDYRLMFSDDNNDLCGFIVIPAQTAVDWVTELLGESNEENQEAKTLSRLEESLLLDIAASVMDALSLSQNVINVYITGELAKNSFPVTVEPSQELCRIDFNIAKDNGENETDNAATGFYLLITCEKLTHLLGTAKQLEQQASPENISKTMLKHLQQTAVTMTAKLAATNLKIGQVIALEPGDTILLDRKIDEPIELIVEDKKFFAARPAKSVGNYAALITDIIE